MEKKKKNQSGKEQDKKPEIRPDVPPFPAPADQPGNKIRITTILLAVALLACAVFLGIQLFTATQSGPVPAGESGNVTVYFFYGTECPHCHNVMPYVESLQKKYPDVDFRILEVWHNDTNNALLSLMNHKLGREDGGVPEIVVGNISLLGEDEIKTGLEPAILWQRGNLTGSSVLGGSPVITSSSGNGSEITALFFYGNGCSHCEKVEPRVDAIQARYPGLHVEKLEVNDNKTNRQLLTEMVKSRTGSPSWSLPVIFIGGDALIGETEAEDHFEEKVLAEKQKLQGTVSAPFSPSSGNITVSGVYFYGDNCIHCEKVKPDILNISSRYPELNLTWLEIDHSADNRQRLIDMSSRYGIPNPGTPTIFIGDHVLVGEGEVANRLETEILNEKQRIASGIPSNLTQVTPGNQQPETAGLSLYMVVFAALIDSTNPCGLSVLVFLLISMAAAGNRKRILLVGGVYVFAMFLFHLLVGIGLFSAFSISGLAKPFSIIGGLIALVLGIVTLIDVLRNKESYLLSIPESGKGMLGTYTRKATLPAAFILGILAGIMGFSCTGGIYISILGLMGRDMTVMTGLPWLILYNIIFVLPLVLVTLLVAYGVSPERADRWRTENKRMVRVIIGIILIALGIIILSGWMG